MKKYIFSFVFVAFFVPALVHAEEAGEVTKRRPDRPAQVEIQEIRQTKMQEFRSNVAENHANRLEKRFTSYYERFMNIITRFEKRLAILKADDKDVSLIEDKLSKATSTLQAAKTAGEEAVIAFKSIDPAKFSEQKDQVFAARDLANSARKSFLETHRLLKDALKALKTVTKPALPADSAAVENTK